MTYYKFLAPGRVPPYRGGDPWPEPGIWTHRVDRPALCQRGWHLCRPMDLAAHIHAELWIVESAPRCRVIEGDDKVVVSRARLVSRVETWNDETARACAYAFADRAVRVHAVAALRAAGRDQQADMLAALAPIVDEKTAAHASAAAGDAGSAAWYAGAGAAARAAAGAAARAAAGAAAGAAATAAAGAAATAAARAAHWQTMSQKLIKLLKEAR